MEKIRFKINIKNQIKWEQVFSQRKIYIEGNEVQHATWGRMEEDTGHTIEPKQAYSKLCWEIHSMKQNKCVTIIWSYISYIVWNKELSENLNQKIQITYLHVFKKKLKSSLVKQNMESYIWRMAKQISVEGRIKKWKWR